MHHPFHVRGAGRFVLLARDSLPEANLVWKDTGHHEPASVDAHSHIPGTSEAGMMLSIEMLPAHAV